MSEEKALRNVINDKPITELIKLKLLKKGLIQRVSWSHYVITEKGYKEIKGAN